MLSAGSEGREIPLFLFLLLSSFHGDAVCIPRGEKGEKEASCPCLQRLLSLLGHWKGRGRDKQNGRFRFSKRGDKKGGGGFLFSSIVNGTGEGRRREPKPTLHGAPSLSVFLGHTVCDCERKRKEEEEEVNLHLNRSKIPLFGTALGEEGERERGQKRGNEDVEIDVSHPSLGSSSSSSNCDQCLGQDMGHLRRGEKKNFFKIQPKLRFQMVE